ncbi:winged helix DNA-binding domain-containing protein [Sphaerisporangium rhizosphaerae]|uniref:Winged helix DNA-binding domain-containing protein n=1 Tax=Sphaerisporangium rhizosphaerae TaxID=2269375 RepID=A0ABW2P9K4_9ACTN
MTVLDIRALNRATLERQLLLRRASLTALEAVERLVGMQAQAPFPPYTGLWTRLSGFQPDELSKLLIDRGVVRLALMRSTVHLVSAADCLALRPVLQPMLERTLRAAHAGQLAALDVEEVVAFGRALVEERPRDTGELGRLLMERWPGLDRQALLNIVRTYLPLVQVPPRAVWGKSGRPTVTTAESWLGRPMASSAAPDAMVLRYLSAFGPATVADVQKWSGLTRLQEVVERLGPALRVFRDERGATLYDLPDAPRPDPGVPAPVRFLPEFDNLLLSYADGSRVVAAEHRPALFTVNGIIRASVLVDGVARASWKITESRAGKGARGMARLVIQPFTRLSAGEVSAVQDEGARLLAFSAPDAPHEIELAPPP